MKLVHARQFVVTVGKTLALLELGESNMKILKKLLWPLFSKEISDHVKYILDSTDWAGESRSFERYELLALRKHMIIIGESYFISKTRGLTVGDSYDIDFGRKIAWRTDRRGTT
jgi:hypothetical protein